MAGNVIVDYPSLQTAVQDWLARASYTDSNFLPEIIRAGEDRLYQGYTDNRGNYWPGLRIRQMEKAIPGGGLSGFNITGGANYAQSDTVAFAAPPAGGVQATGLLSINPTTGAITGVTLTNPGMGYTSPPAAVISTSTGSGGSIVCTVSAAAAISPSGNLAVPSDYLELKYCIIAAGGGTERLERKEPGWLYQNYPYSAAAGMPCYIGRDGGVFIMKPAPDSQYPVSGLYYFRDTPLSDSYTSNWIINSNPINFGNLLLACCLAEGFKFARDQVNADWWEQRSQTLLRNTQAADTQERMSGSPLAMTPQ